MLLQQAQDADQVFGFVQKKVRMIGLQGLGGIISPGDSRHRYSRLLGGNNVPGFISDIEDLAGLQTHRAHQIVDAGVLAPYLGSAGNKIKDVQLVVV